MLSLFSGRKKRQKAQHAVVDRIPYRQRALDLLQLLHISQPAGISEKLIVLRSLTAKLEQLFEDLVAAGDRDPAVKAMGEVVLRLQTLLAQSQRAETDILDVWMRIENCLQHWLALGETTPRREGFWK